MIPRLHRHDPDRARRRALPGRRARYVTSLRPPPRARVHVLPPRRRRQRAAIPALAGRPATEIKGLLGDFRAGRKTNPVMVSVAKSLDDEQMTALAAYFASLPRSGKQRGAAALTCYKQSWTARTGGRRSHQRTYSHMKLRVGYELKYAFPNPTPAILMLNVHFTRVSDLSAPDHIIITPSVPISGYRDGFGNWCSRIVAPAGQVRISTDAVVRDSGLPDSVLPGARQIPVEELPEESLVFLLASRFSDSDRMLDLAWKLFGHATPGLGRVQAICDFVHQHIEFGYEHARVTRTASEAYEEKRGVCRDYAHLAVAFCQGIEHPGPLLHGLPRRRRHAASLSARRLRGVVRGFPRRRLVHFRPAQQCSTHRQSFDRARTGRRRRRHDNHVRAQHARGLPGLDRRDYRRRSGQLTFVIFRRRNGKLCISTTLFSGPLTSEKCVTLLESHT